MSNEALIHVIFKNNTGNRLSWSYLAWLLVPRPLILNKYHISIRPEARCSLPALVETPDLYDRIRGTRRIILSATYDVCSFPQLRNNASSCLMKKTRTYNDKIKTPRCTRSLINVCSCPFTEFDISTISFLIFRLPKDPTLY